MPIILARHQLEGEIFLLTFPFIELYGRTDCPGTLTGQSEELQDVEFVSEQQAQVDHILIN